jgi:hypothetical protein
MKPYPVFGAAALFVLGTIGGCSSDENASTGGPSEAGPGGGNGNGGSATGGASATGGSVTATGGTVSTGGAVGTGGARITDAGSDARGPEQTGQMCKTVADCFPNIDAGALSGAVECLTKVQDGYCTHKCNTDADCCKVPGECRTDLKQVCSPFENTGYKVCFLSCEPGDIRLPGDAGTTLADGAPAFTDANDFCHKEASAGLNCRSTGGGGTNRKVCLPAGGAPGGDGGPRPGDASTDGAVKSDAASDASKGAKGASGAG